MITPAPSAHVYRLLWLIIGLVALLLGIAGIILPILPTTPFAILAAFAFGKSAPAWAARLERHQVVGPLIRDWRERRVIPPRAKALAVMMMVAALSLSIWAGVSVVVLIVQALCLSGAAIFVLTRASGR